MRACVRACVRVCVLVAVRCARPWSVCVCVWIFVNVSVSSRVFMCYLKVTCEQENDNNSIL